MFSLGGGIIHMWGGGGGLISRYPVPSLFMHFFFPLLQLFYFFKATFMMVIKNESHSNKITQEEKKNVINICKIITVIMSYLFHFFSV